MKYLLTLVLALVLGAAQAQTIWYTDGGQVGAISEDHLDLALELIADNDLTALQGMIDRGEAFAMPNNAECYLIDSIWFGKVKMRVKGTTVFFFTVTEGIKRTPSPA